MSGGHDLAEMRRIADRHAVYRMFDAGKRLLYVGMSRKVGHRFDQHTHAVWFSQVATITLEWFPSEAAATVAERRAIHDERPRYNLSRPAPVIVKRGLLIPEEISCEMAQAIDDLSLVAAVRVDLKSGAAKVARQRTHLKQVEIADSLGVSRQSVSQWESGDAVPTDEHALAYGRLLRQLGKAAA